MNPTTYSRMKSAEGPPIPKLDRGSKPNLGMKGVIVRTAIAAAVAFAAYFTPSAVLAHTCKCAVVPGKQRAADSTVDYAVETKKEGRKSVRTKTDKVTSVTLIIPVNKGKAKQTLSVSLPGPLFEGISGDSVEGVLYANAKAAIDRYYSKAKKKTWKCEESPVEVPALEGEPAPKKGWMIGGDAPEAEKKPAAGTAPDAPKADVKAPELGQLSDKPMRDELKKKLDVLDDFVKKHDTLILGNLPRLMMSARTLLDNANASEDDLKNARAYIIRAYWAARELRVDAEKVRANKLREAADAAKKPDKPVLYTRDDDGIRKMQKAAKAFLVVYYARMLAKDPKASFKAKVTGNVNEKGVITDVQVSGLPQEFAAKFKNDLKSYLFVPSGSPSSFDMTFNFTP